MTFEQIGKDTLEEAVKVNEQIFQGLYPWPPFTLEMYNEKMKDKDAYILVAKDNDELVGDAIGFEQDDSWYIWILGVKKTFRNKGVATRLLEMNEAHARENAYNRVRIKIYNVSEEMLHLSIKRGYNIIATIPHENPLYHAVIVETYV